MKKTERESEALLRLLRRAAELPDARPLQDNLFAILKMENREVAAHSAFLAYLFSKPAFLCSFLETVLGKEVTSDDFGFEREAVFDGGRIDFVFWNGGRPAALEMKVWAGEQAQQIERYRSFLAENGGDEDDVYFLTPLPRGSVTGRSHNITFGSDLLPWLQAIGEDASGEVRFLIGQYAELIKNLCGTAMEDRQKRELITGKKDVDDIGKLIAARDAFFSRVLAVLFDDLRERAKRAFCARGMQAVYSPSAYESEAIAGYYGHTTYWPQLFYKVLLPEEMRAKAGLTDGEDLYFAFEIYRYAYCGFTIRRTTETGTEFVSDPEKFYPLCDRCARVSGIRSSKNASLWPAWQYIRLLNKKIDFKSCEGGYWQLLQRRSGESAHAVNGSLQLNESAVSSVIEQMSALYRKGIEIILA